MFVSIIPERKSGRKLILFVEGYRDGKKVRQRQVKRIGYLDEFEDRYPDPIAHFKEVAKQETELKKLSQQKVVVELSPEARLSFDAETGNYDCVKNIGYAAISKIVYRLGIPKFIDDRRKYLDIGYNLTAVMKLLIYERLLAPDSKRKNWFHKSKYFENMDFDLNAVYRSLSILSTYREKLIIHLHKVMVDRYKRNTTMMFYDVTNYYFEIENEDELRRNGCSKENRRLPIVQMDLFMDSNGFPVAYDLYPGNNNDCTTFTPMSEKVREQLNMKHMIFVADKGMMSGTNVADVITHHNGYVFSKSVRKAKEKFKDYVRDSNGYIRFDKHGNIIQEGDSDTEVSYRYKVSDDVTDLRVNTHSGAKKKVKNIGCYQIVIWSRKYAMRAQLDRSKAVERAMLASHTQSKEVIDNNHGKNKYLKTAVSNAKTGEVIDNYTAQVKFDCEQLDEDESLDGYYIIETNVIGWRPVVDAKGRETGEREGDFGKESRWLKQEGLFQLNKIVGPEDIIEMYHGLWKIEQSFRITKSELHARPVYVSRKDRIEAHFLTCFISLLIVRLLEYETENEYSSEQLLTSLKNANVAKLDGSHFLTLYYDKVLWKLKDRLGLDFGRNVYTKEAIKKMIGDTKKQS
jgi:transposase